MKTQLLVTVKNESLFSKFKTTMWFINIFKKSTMNLVLDNQAMVLKASKEPYAFDLAPGVHTLLVTDPRAKGKKISNAMTGAILGASMGLAGGSGTGALVYASEFADAFGGNSREDGSVEFSIGNGDIIHISCKATSNGRIKIKHIG